MNVNKIFFENGFDFYTKKYVGKFSDTYFVNKGIEKYILKVYKNNFDLFENELHINNKLKDFEYSPKIIKYDFEKKYIIFEFIDGISLNEMSKKKDSLKIVNKILDTVNNLHKLNIIHCDLKPGNLILKDDKIYLVDFGNSKDLNGTFISKTMSLNYCAPEQLLNGKLSFQTDIYPIGVMLFEFITGSKPIVVDDKEKLIYNKTHFDTSNIKFNNKDLEYVIKKALDSDFDKRYSDCLDMKKDLEKVIL